MTDISGITVVEDSYIPEDFIVVVYKATNSRKEEFIVAVREFGQQIEPRPGMVVDRVLMHPSDVVKLRAELGT